MRVSSFKGFLKPVSNFFLANQISEDLQQSLTEKMISHRSEILEAIKSSPGIARAFREINKKDYVQYSENQYDAFLESLKEYQQNEQKTPFWLRIYQKIQFDLPHEKIPEIAYLVVTTVSARLGVTDGTHVQVLQFVEALSHICDLVRQRYYIGVSHQELVESIFNELRSMDFTPDELVAMGAVQEECAALLKAWAEVNPDGATELELEFILLFLERLVGQFSMPYRFWELLLLKLDNWCQVKAGKKPHHALSDAIEALLSASQRFAFLHHLCNDVIPHYGALGVPLGKLLLLLVTLQARSEGRLLLRFLRANNLDAWQQKLGVSLEDLRQHNREALDLLRGHWERAQIDWFSDALSVTEDMIAAPLIRQQLLVESAHERERFCALLTEGITNASGFQRADQLLEVIIGEAVNAVSLANNILLTRYLFRTRTVSHINLDEDLFFWKKFREISLALQRFEPSSEQSRRVFERLLPLYAGFDGLVQDVLQSQFNWFGDADGIAAVAGEETEKICVTLQMLAFFRRFYLPYQVVASLKFWYGTVFAPGDSRSADPGVSIRHFSAASQTLHKNSGDHPGLPLLAEFVAELPALDMAQRLMREASGIAVNAASLVARQCPDFVKRVGKKGIQEGASDNRYVLFKIAQVCTIPNGDPRAGLLWWWNIAVAPYLLTYHRQAYQQNLRGLFESLEDKLPAPEAKLAVELLRAVYQEALGISLGDMSELDTGIGTIGAIGKFHELPIRGPLWSRLVNPQRLPSIHLQYIEETAENWVGDASGGQLLRVFLQGLRDHADEELAWEGCRAIFTADVQALGTRSTEQHWRALLAEIPTVLDAGVASFWTQVLTHGVNLIRQIGLGEVLATQREELLAGCQDLLAQSIGEAQLQEQLQGFRLLDLLDYLARAWQGHPPGLAVLNVSRYVIEVMAARVRFSAQEWRLLWLCLEEAMSSHLDVSESLGLHSWVVQLDSLSEHLPAMASLGQEVFMASEEVLAETRTAEGHWRQCLGGLLAAAATPLDAPVSGRYLAQRLVLGSPIFQAETASSWSQRQLQLGEAFTEVFSGKLGRRVADRHADIIRSLSALTQLEQARRLRATDIQYIMLSDARDAQQLWQLDMAVRQVTAEENVPTPGDLLVAQLNGWVIPDNQDLAQRVNDHVNACQLPSEISVHMKRWGGLSSTTLSLSSEQSSELHLLLRLMTLRQSLNDSDHQTDQFRNWLFETLSLSFNEFDSDEQSAMFGALRKTLVERQGSDNMLSLEWQKLCIELQRSSFSVRLSRDSKSLVKTALENQQVSLAKQSTDNNTESDRVSLSRHMGSILRYLGYYLGGTGCSEKVGDWYWRRIGEFLPARLGKLEEQIIAAMPRALHKTLSSTELALLDKYLKEIRQTLSEKRNQQTLVEHHENG